MSETAGTTAGSHSIAKAPARTQIPAYAAPAAEPVAHEAYAFACLHCGHGWEQAYDIEHHVDALGQPYVSYHADGERVPSPLTKPTCLNCGAHLLRIMRSGQVSSACEAMSHGRTGAKPPTDADHHHWHLADLWPFHRK
ncbi:hypothetical protein AAHZ94_17815 [Streptomyces sp. HSW2009]|uniref:hypothetical protein n=1 Tax=Streptomyces sp. HSW2009 TaxID=3142890 RepID=UPI0032EB0CB3